MKLSNILRSARAFTNTSQKEVSTAIGMTRVAYMMIEADKTIDPHFSTVIKIKHFLEKKGAPAIDLNAIDAPKKK